MERTYIAGPMTGYPLYNFPAFIEAEEYLKDKFEVVSPVNLTLGLWVELGIIKNKEEWMQGIDNPFEKAVSKMTYLRKDLSEIAKCDCMVFIDGWKGSEGAAKELKMAQLLNLKLYELVKIDGTNNLVPLVLNGWKFSGNKLKWHLFYRPWLRGVCDILTGGALKYAPAPEDNWKKVPRQDYVNAMERHVDAIQAGELIDPESGRPHTYHIGCDAMFTSWFDDQKNIDGDKTEEEKEVITI